VARGRAPDPRRIGIRCPVNPSLFGQTWSSSNRPRVRSLVCVRIRIRSRGALLERNLATAHLPFSWRTGGKGPGDRGSSTSTNFASHLNHLFHIGITRPTRATIRPRHAAHATFLLRFVASVACNQFSFALDETQWARLCALPAPLMVQPYEDSPRAVISNSRRAPIRSCPGNSPAGNRSTARRWPAPRFPSASPRSPWRSSLVAIEGSTPRS
jgi:hypothetical protein